jgi:hypothetical protein
MSIENIIENSCEIVGNYFIAEQERRDNDNKKKMLEDLTNNVKNGLIKELNGEELFTPDYKRDYFENFKQTWLKFVPNRQRANGNRRLKVGSPNLVMGYESNEELFDSYFSNILKHVNDNEYIIGLYGGEDNKCHYIIAFTNRLNIIKFYNEYDIKLGVYNKLIDTTPNRRLHQLPFTKDTKLPVGGIQKDTHDLLLNNLQIDLIHKLFNKFSGGGGICSTEIGITWFKKVSTSKNGGGGNLGAFSRLRWNSGLPDYYLYYTDIVEHIVYMFKTYWTGKFISPYAKQIEIENKHLNEIHSKIYDETIYKKQKQELDDKTQECNEKIALLEKTTIKEKEVSEKLNTLEMLEIVLKEKRVKLKEIQNENKKIMEDVQVIKENIFGQQIKIDRDREQLKKEKEQLKKEKEHFEKYKNYLLEQDI